MIMSDADEENHRATPKPAPRTTFASQPDPNSIMDLDFADFDSPWQFDPMLPASPFILSDQAFSSLWAFADFSDDKSSSAVAGSGFLRLNCMLLHLCRQYHLLLLILVIG